MTLIASQLIDLLDPSHARFQSATTRRPARRGASSGERAGMVDTAPSTLTSAAAAGDEASALA
jgi:hypothetical protein